jgi:hypothetical protein
LVIRENNEDIGSIRSRRSGRSRGCTSGQNKEREKAQQNLNGGSWHERKVQGEESKIANILFFFPYIHPYTRLIWKTKGRIRSKSGEI